MNKRQSGLIIAFFSVLILLTGCAKGTAHMTVKKDGSMDIAFNLLLDARAESLVGGKVEEVLASRLQSAGIELDKSRSGDSTEYQFLKSYGSIKDLTANAGNFEIVDTQVEQSDKWLYTVYDIEVQPKLTAYSDEIIESIGSLSVPESLVRLVLGSLALDFKLTLPFDLYGDNNADSQDGSTLTWHITMADSEPLQMIIYVPNITNVAIAAGGVLLVIAVVITVFIRKRKARRPKSA
ncbi:hypothetical protein C2I18_07150 [Paenibacillus sp. PK3_47]|uniref:hypothetical protein n=1 Tax=Paenibacillus sp. PK3_47 TaxID=2072642 RepID=UPI00201E04D8|nr:hypothetical protein [Paenibacillus sp. PK3_47]UQZ33354.1 hypothetical protein C2I18_07150 [Paenibacillus sp. PK3_47]